MPAHPIDPPDHVRLTETMRAAGRPVTGTSGTGPADVRLSFEPGATPAQIAAALNYAQNTFDWSQAAHAAWLRDRKRQRAADALAHAGEDGKLLRGLMLACLDEINALRAAVVPALPARTAAQLRAAVLAKIAGGDAD